MQLSSSLVTYTLPAREDYFLTCNRTAERNVCERKIEREASSRKCSEMQREPTMTHVKRRKDLDAYKGYV